MIYEKVIERKLAHPSFLDLRMPSKKLLSN